MTANFKQEYFLIQKFNFSNFFSTSDHTNLLKIFKNEIYCNTSLSIERLDYPNRKILLNIVCFVHIIFFIIINEKFPIIMK
jgi:hypothetical protein